MDREGFRNRLKQYKLAREENPGLKYWEWKDIPKYDEGTGGITQPFVTDGNNWRKRPTQELLDAFYKGDVQRLIELALKAGQLITYSNPAYTLDEVVVTANRPKRNQYSELDFAKDVAGFVPVLGDAIDIYDAGKALYNSDYSKAALLGAGLLLPNWLEKSGKHLYRGLRNNWRRFKRNLNTYPRSNDKYMLGESVYDVSFRTAENQLKKMGIERYITEPFLNKETEQHVLSNYKNAQFRNFSSTQNVMESIISNNPGYTTKQMSELQILFLEDPRYADFIFTHPELDPLSPQTVDMFINKQNSFIRGVYSEEDSDELITKMLTENTSNASNKKGGDRLGTSLTGIYVSNSGEIADRFQRSLSNTVRSDIGFLQKTPATDVNVPIRERLAAERRRIFPFDVVPGTDLIPYETLVDLGYVAKEALYTTRFGNKLPGYERAYISNDLDAPNLVIKDLQTTKANLSDKKGRWGIGGVSSVPELEDKLFEGLNIGTSYGDYLHLMRALKSPKLVRKKYNPDFNANIQNQRKLVENIFVGQINKQRALQLKLYDNPYLNIVRNIEANKPAIAGIGGLSTIIGTGVYGMMDSDRVKSRRRLNRAYKDDDFAQFARQFDASQYDSSTDMANDMLNKWNEKNPTKTFAEGGKVTGPPTYDYWYTDITTPKLNAFDDAYLHVNINDAAADLHNIAMTLPGYANKWNEYQRSRPKEDPSIDEFVNDLWANENPNNVGYRNGKYYPHKSPEGGKMTIGPGFKLDSGSHGISTKIANSGMTKTRLNQEARKIGKQHLKAVDQFINYGQTTNPADTISPQIKMGLMDLRHQVGPLNEWGNLRQAVLNGDLEGIRKESTVTWNDNGKTKVDKRRKKIRDEKYFYYE